MNNVEIVNFKVSNNEVVLEFSNGTIASSKLNPDVEDKIVCPYCNSPYVAHVENEECVSDGNVVLDMSKSRCMGCDKEFYIETIFRTESVKVKKFKCS